MERLVGNCFTQRTAALHRYFDTLKALIGTYSDLPVEIAEWIERLISVGKEYTGLSSVHCAVPRISVSHDLLPDKSVKRFEGRTESLDYQSCKITCFFHLFNFELPDYFSIPSVLSHEFWCHCLSRLLPTTGSTEGGEGCNPIDVFEEGWMEYVAKVILDSAIDRVLNPGDDAPTFAHYCEVRTRQRLDSSPSRLFGFRAAYALHNFLVQNCEEIRTDPNEVFMQVSLDLNALNCSMSVKAEFVDGIAKSLQSGVTALPLEATHLEKSLVVGRDHLQTVIISSLESGKCNVTRLLKSLIINDV